VKYIKGIKLMMLVYSRDKKEKRTNTDGKFVRVIIDV